MEGGPIHPVVQAADGIPRTVPGAPAALVGGRRTVGGSLEEVKTQVAVHGCASDGSAHRVGTEGAHPQAGDGTIR